MKSLTQSSTALSPPFPCVCVILFILYNLVLVKGGREIFGGMEGDVVRWF